MCRRPGKTGRPGPGEKSRRRERSTPHEDTDVRTGSRDEPYHETKSRSGGAKTLPTNAVGDRARIEHTGGSYDTWTVTGIDGRKWKLVSDASIDGPFERHAEMAASALERGIHVFCEKPIALDFAQLETLRRAPGDMFAGQKLDGNDRLDVLFNNRSGNGRRGLSYDPVMYRSVIPYWEAGKEGLTRMVLMPIEEQFALPRPRAGWPRRECGMRILEHLAEISRPYGVEVALENGFGMVKL